MKLILRYLLRYKRLLFLNIISVSGFALAELGIPTIVSDMVDSGIEAGDPTYIYSRFWLILLAGILGTVGTLALAYFSNRISTRIMYDIRQDLFGHVMELSKQDIEKFGVSSLITRTGQDPYQIMIFTNTLLRSALISPVMLVVSVLLVTRVSWPLSWIVIATLPVIILGVYLIFKPAGRLSEASQKSIDRINEILRENIGGIRVVRAFNRQKYEEKRFKKENAFYTRTASSLFKLTMVSEPMFFFLMNICCLMVYYFGSLMIGQGTLLIGQLMVFIEYVFHCMMSILVFCMVFVMYPRASISAKRIQAVLSTVPSIQDGMDTNTDIDAEANPDGLSASADHLIPAVESLRFEDVSFVYPDGKGRVLEHVSFEARAGEKIAVIGATGSGKSSLAQLIERFYDPQKGTIYINDRDIRSYPLHELRSMVGYISQKAHIFTGSIQDNITFGAPDASSADVQEAARIAQALDFILERPDGFDNEISEEGTNLSGGQKQRLSIARALIRKPGLYIFDDSFSALDFRTDAALRHALAPHVQNAILLVVAQRVSTILDADKIIVLDHGRIAGIGRHDDLMQTCELYREIVLSQMSEEEAGYARA